MFAVVLRKLAQGDPAALEMAKAATGDGNRDALAHYASRFAALGMRNDRGGVDTLRHLFVLMIGLRHARIVGPLLRRPRPRRPQHDDTETAEAGLFQMSWDANTASRHS